MLQKVDKTVQNLERCLCLDCPSYTTSCKIKNIFQNAASSTQNLQDHTHFEKMFCAFEKSNCIHSDNGCICQRCANFKEYNLKN